MLEELYTYTDVGKDLKFVVFDKRWGTPKTTLPPQHAIEYFFENADRTYMKRICLPTYYSTARTIEDIRHAADTIVTDGAMLMLSYTEINGEFVAHESKFDPLRKYERVYVALGLPNKVKQITKIFGKWLVYIEKL